MTDGQTDGQTELRWLRRAIAVPAVARKNAKYNVILNAIILKAPDKMLLIVIKGERDKRYFKFLSSHRIIVEC